MSTKKLARTILEAGSRTEGKVIRRKLKRKERTQQRAFLRKLKNDLGYTDTVSEPIRGFCHKIFDDNLGAVYRFLNSWVDKKWDQARSEMMEKFNPKSLPGRHIIYDHILKEVYPNEDALRARYSWSRFRETYYVDDNGFLRKTERANQAHRKNYNFTQVSVWLGNRRIAQIGEKYYWFITKSANCKWDMLEIINESYKFDGFISGFQPTIKVAKLKTPVVGNCKQGEELNEQDIELFIKLPYWLKQEILEQSPFKIVERKNEYLTNKEKEKTNKINYYKEVKGNTFWQ